MNIKISSIIEHRTVGDSFYYVGGTIGGRKQLWGRKRLIVNISTPEYYVCMYLCIHMFATLPVANNS